MPRLILPILLALATSAQAEEGFWAFHAIPRERMAADLGAAPPDKVFDKLKGATVRFGGYCTGVLAGPGGLLLTNQHCAIDCVKGLSAPGNDSVANGFTARTREEEQVCAGLSAEVPESDVDITADIKAALRGLSGAAYAAALEERIGHFVSECQGEDEEGAPGRKQSDTRTCAVATMFDGAEFRLQAFRVFRDVRLVFAPENAAANFGGDPDNFNFPRYGFDMALLRLYENGKPADVPGALAWREAPPEAGEALFVAGYPGYTSRHYTLAQLETMRDVYLPWTAIRLSEFRGRLIQFAIESAENRRIAAGKLYEVENDFKATRGEYDTLADPAMMAKKAAEEAALRAKIAADPALAAQVGSAFEDIAAAEEVYRRFHRLNDMSHLIDESGLWGMAQGLVRAARERAKPEPERLADYVDANLPSIEQALLSEETFEPRLDALRLAFGLSKLREYLGPGHPLSVAALGKDTPEALAEKLVAGTGLQDVAARRRLYEGGAAAIAASKDPLIRLAAFLDPTAFAEELRYRNEVEAPELLAHQRIAAARNSGGGAGRYPDANGTLRFSYGRVMGWTTDQGADVPACTKVEGLARRATGAEPFALAPVWSKALSKLDPNLAFNCVTTHDVVGGNSGSPVVDGNGDLVGLMFDGNLPSLGGTYLYDGAKNRAIFVTIALIGAALREVYEMPALAPPQK